MVKKYTKLETELYEKLVDIFVYFKEFEKSFVGNLYHSKKKNIDDIDKPLINFLRLSKTIKFSKIPKKFLILNKLEENKKND